MARLKEVQTDLSYVEWFVTLNATIQVESCRGWVVWSS